MTAVEFGPVTAGDALVLPWCADAPAVELRYDGLGPEPIFRRFRLAQNRVDQWRRIPLGGAAGGTVGVSGSSPAIARARVLAGPSELTSTVHGVLLPFADHYDLLAHRRTGASMLIDLSCDLLGEGSGRDRVRLASSDGITWTLDSVVFDAVGPEDPDGIALASVATPDGTLVCLVDRVLHPPVHRLRIWERRVSAADGLAELPLRFRVVPSTWPEIALADADGTSGDVTAPAHELRLTCDPGVRGSVAIALAGISLRLSRRSLDAGTQRLEVPRTGPIGVSLYVQAGHAALIVDDLAPVLLRGVEQRDELSAVAVTPNVADFTIASHAPSSGRIRLAGDAVLQDAVLYGLREPRTGPYRAALGQIAPGELFYGSQRFGVYARQVRESDGPFALVPDRTTIISPTRVVEEFAWRPTPYGDMTRVVDRAELWRSRVEPGRFPALRTSFPTVDAAFELALETFQRNSSAEFALPGQEGRWSAGYFQGPGLGFGAWRRDSSHIALRCGNLLDREVARASLAHIVREGFDNGSDGDSLPAPAIWDYVLASGDESLAIEAWERLTGTATALDARFDERRGLVSAAQATSNDCFDEPEAGGFALSTEIYSMQTYVALAGRSRIAGIDDPRAGEWQARAEAMRRAIVEQYWSPRHGYFTSGPVGSESHTRGYWETSGAEAALWGFLGAGVEPLLPGVLGRLREVALSDFGVVLFPYKAAENHFCNSVWYCWQAGIARAAARNGDAELVHRLIGQQVRTVLLHKTFYEVTDATTGESWRWPGQLWHAAGFASLLLFGVFGIHYDASGMTFTPAVPVQFDGASLRGLRYRGATLDVEVRGHGSRGRILMAGQPVRRVPADTLGHHTVVLEMR